MLCAWAEHEADWYVQARDDEIYRWTSERRDLTAAEARAAIARLADNGGLYGFALADRTTGQLLAIWR